VRSGLLSSAEYYLIVFSKNASESLVASIRNSLPRSVARFDSGTKVVMEWRKLNGEVWLPVHTIINGSESQVLPSCDQRKVRSLRESSFKVQQETVFSDYKKFRAETRILSPE
jgi:hypothetical protein